jgi:hypothetical protein
MAKKFVPEDFIGKPARISGASVWPLLGKDDGKGSATVKFQLQFRLQDKDDKYITAEGKVTYIIRAYRSAYYSNDPRLIAVGGPSYNEVMEDSKVIMSNQAVDIASFREGYASHQGLPYIDIVTSPIKGKIDVVEWRYIYSINFVFRTSWLGSGNVRYGHTSTYQSFDFRFNEKEIQEIRTLLSEFANADKADKELKAIFSDFSDERLRGMSPTERQQLLETLREGHNKKKSSKPRAG